MLLLWQGMCTQLIVRPSLVSFDDQILIDHCRHWASWQHWTASRWVKFVCPRSSMFTAVRSHCEIQRWHSLDQWKMVHVLKFAYKQTTALEFSQSTATEECRSPTCDAHSSEKKTSNAPFLLFHWWKRSQASARTLMHKQPNSSFTLVSDLKIGYWSPISVPEAGTFG